jgi:hypothetical protein
MYRVRFHSRKPSGFYGPSRDFETREEARGYAARLLRGPRSRHRAVTIEPGLSWEVSEPEDCVLVLSLTRSV